MAGKDIDVTDKTQIAWIDDGTLGIDKCVCGLALNEFTTLDLNRSDPWQCSKCGRELYITQSTVIWEKR